MKNYIKGSAKTINTKFGELINMSLFLEDLQNLPQYKGYVRLTVAPRKEVGQFGDTHSVFENDYFGGNSGEEESDNKTSK